MEEKKICKRQRRKEVVGQKERRGDKEEKRERERGER